MLIDKENFFNQLGFNSDPFASTNASHEDFLERYFIKPPYFHSLIGSVDRPKSSIVIAPRGTGKTAQRRMLEKLPESNSKLICLLYDNFPIEGVTDPSLVTYEQHLRRIIKYLVIALLSKLEDDDINYIFDSHDKEILKKLIRVYLSGITTAEVSNAITAIKGIKGKLYDLWLSAGKSINSIINAMLKTKGIDGINLTVESAGAIQIPESDLTDALNIIESLFNKIGISAVFILIDSVDETNITGNDSRKSYELVRPLIKDLRLLERRTIVFKFFLWDKIQEHWNEDIRKDRIEIFLMEWTNEKIRHLISSRLKAYSEDKISLLNQILKTEEKIIDTIFNFSSNSPRDLINILKTIFDHHLNNIDDFSIPDESIVLKGIDEFCKNKFEEIVPTEKQRKDLKRVKLATFTIPYLYTDVFKCNDSTARNILMPWTRAGIVISSNNKIRVNRSANPINAYTFKDIRIARHVCSNQKLEEFIGNNLFVCEECKTINVFDKDNKYGICKWQCYDCQSDLII